MASKLVVYLLVISLFPFMTNSPNQVSTSLTTIMTSSTLTSYSTYTIGMTQVTATVTGTIYNGNLPLAGWSIRGCSLAAFPFNANPGDQLTVNFISDVPIDFHLMTAPQFQRLPPSTSLCPYGAIPVVSGIKSVSYVKTFSFSWTAQSPGQYYIAFMDLQAVQASVMLSAVVTSLQTKQLAVNATTTTTITSVNEQTLNTFVTVQSSTGLSGGLPAQSLQWFAAVLIVVALVVTYLLSRKRASARLN
jgi:hypothetical protein